MVQSDDKLQFVFNDNVRNFTKRDRKSYAYTFTGSSDAMVVMASVDASGNVSTQPLFNDEVAGVHTRPKICRQISKNELVIYGEDRNDYRFGVIKTK